MQLDPIAAGEGVRLEAFATVGSTNAEARDRARRGERGPLWITAITQTQGRGRLGRSWVSPSGNLHASLLLHDPSPVDRAPELAFVAALAVRDAIVAEAPGLAPRLALKWPNDLLLADRKCAGILIEGEFDPDRGASVVIGIGVNCAHHPPSPSDRLPPDVEPTLGAAAASAEPAVSFPATDLSAHGAAVTAERLFRRLSATMCLRLAQWNRGRGFPAILDDWLAAARGLGEPVRVRNGGGEKTGRFAGLDRFGRLILELPGGGRETISAGDVFPFDLSHGRDVQSGRG